METVLLLKKLVEIRSVSGEEEEISDFVYNYLEEKGFKPEKVENNVVVSLGEGGKKLFFNAHLDTVEASGDWKHPPFDAVEENGKIYGLGASDNKSQTASLLKTVENLKDSDLDKEVVFMFTEKEEVDGSGTKKVLNWLEKRKDLENAAAVVTEPTEMEWVYNGCKGTAWIKAQLKTDGGHASRDLNNPIAEIHKLWKKFQEKLPEEKPQPKAELTVIEAGNSINKIPSQVEAKFDVRTTPEFTADDAMQKMKDLAEELESQATIQFTEDPAPPSNSKNSEIVKHAKNISGAEKAVFAKAANDACFFTQKGINAAVIGPGNHECIHQPDEYVEKNRLKKGEKTFTQIAKQW